MKVIVNLNDSFINDFQCSFDVNSDNTYEIEKEYSSSQYSSDSENIRKIFYKYVI